MDDEWTSDEDEVTIKTDSESDDDAGLEAPSRPPTPEETPEPPKPKPVKPKKKMSEKQLKALAAGRAKRDKGRAERKAVQNEKLAIRKANLEKKTIRKAVALKRREALEEAALVLSEEDTADELEVKQVKRLVAKRKTKAKAKAKPKANPQEAQIEPVQEQPQYVFY